MKIHFLDHSAINFPLSLTDLCDDVLLEIFSYLNLFDGIIVLPSTCKRFRDFICQNKLPAKAIRSMEFETLNRSSKRNFNYDKVFEKVGSHLKKFTFNSSENGFEFNLMLKSIAKYCYNISSMEITDLLHASIVKKLPKSLQKLTVGDFRGRCLDIRELINLKNLHLTSSHTLAEVKVHQLLKEFHLKLYLGRNMPDHVKINHLTTMVGGISHVELHLDYASTGDFFGGLVHLIALGDLMQITNLKLFQMEFFFAIITGIEVINPTQICDIQMLCSCKHSVPLSMNKLMRILDNYRGPTVASKVVRFIPEISLIIHFEFDDYDDRYEYFERLHLRFPVCDCKSVEIETLFQ